MEVQLNIEDLRKAKIMVGTPMYGGSCLGTYTQSMNDLCVLCAKNDIDLKFFYLYNESLIQRARNYVVDEFLRSDCTHLIFIDADISFNPLSVLQLVGLQMSDPEKYDVLAGPYPKKSLSWPSVAYAVSREIYDANNPSQLEYFAGEFVLNFIPGVIQFRMDEPVQVLEAGTGFMMVPRTTFDKWREAYPEMSYKPDHLGTANFDGSRNIHAYFHCDIDPESGRYLSEDYFFCQKAIKTGMKIWVAPWIELHHTGTLTFKGSIAALGMIEQKRNEEEQAASRATTTKKRRKIGTRP